MGGGIFKTIGKIAKIVIPAALAYVTGGGSLIAAGLSAAGSIASGALRSAPKQQNVLTGAMAATSQTPAAPVDSQEVKDQKAKLALQASGTTDNSTSPLGVTKKATVTKRNLLGS